MRQCSASLAGMLDAPGSVSPSVSVIAVIVRRGAHRHAVPVRARDAVLDLAPLLLA